MDADEECWLLKLVNVFVQSKAMMKLYQSAGKTLLNIDLSELTMNVLWNSLTALQQRSAV